MSQTEETDTDSHTLLQLSKKTAHCFEMRRMKLETASSGLRSERIWNVSSEFQKDEKEDLEWTERRVQ